MKRNNLKKFLLLFTVIACVFCMTACSSTISPDSMKESAKDKKAVANEADIVKWCEDEIEYLDKTSDEDIMKSAEAAESLSEINKKEYIVNPDGVNVATVEFLNGWIKTREDLGKLKSIDDAEVKISDETGTLCIVSVKATFEQRTCIFEITIDEDFNLVSGAINPTYTTGEKMEKAALNTLLGMGTVFVVLIFISFIIAQLKYVNKIGQKNIQTAEEKAVEEQGVENGIAQIVSNEKNEMDDLELVAVITAAIAASQGTSADGLVVRSIKKVNNWRK